MKVISLLLPKVKAEPRVISMISPKRTGFNWLLPQCNKLRNRFPVIKLSASASIRDIISYLRGYLCERNLNLFVAALMLKMRSW